MSRPRAEDEELKQHVVFEGILGAMRRGVGGCTPAPVWGHHDVGVEVSPVSALQLGRKETWERLGCRAASITVIAQDSPGG